MAGSPEPDYMTRRRSTLLPPSTSRVVGTQELIVAFKDFSGGGELILTHKAGNLARRLGLAPSLKEIEELKAAAGEYCDMSTFATFCKEVTHSADSPELLAELFECYDPEGTGRVPLRVFKSILRNCGEALSQEELDAVLAVLEGPGDEVDYKAFCTRRKPYPLSTTDIDVVGSSATQANVGTVKVPLFGDRHLLF